MADEERDEGGSIPSLPAEARKATEGMMDVMGPAMVLTQLLDAEGRAWDHYVGQMLPKANSTVDASLEEVVLTAILVTADKLLAARRERFNELSMAERLRVLSPAAAGMCGRNVTLKGRDVGTRCVRGAGHSGPCY